MNPLAWRSKGFAAHELGAIIRIVKENRAAYLEAWHEYLARAEAAEPLIRDVSFDDDRIMVEFDDGRAVALPLVWYPRLLNGTPEQRNVWEFIGDGVGIHWEALDEDLSAEGLLHGIPAPRWNAA